MTDVSSPSKVRNVTVTLISGFTTKRQKLTPKERLLGLLIYLLKPLLATRLQCCKQK
eukprot:m.224839 g.224839  ORF g.224839 m.224839 type:complete len:57 (+) comp40005_c0_seq6:3609-3779(+)